MRSPSLQYDFPDPRRRASVPYVASAFLLCVFAFNCVPSHDDPSRWRATANDFFGSDMVVEMPLIAVTWWCLVNTVSLSVIECWLGHAGVVWWIVLTSMNHHASVILRARVCTNEARLVISINPTQGRYGSWRTDASTGWLLGFLLFSETSSRRVKIGSALYLLVWTTIAHFTDGGGCSGMTTHVEFAAFGVATAFVTI